MEHPNTILELLNRLRRQEADWMRTGRWYRLVSGSVVTVGYLYVLVRWRDLMGRFAGLFEGRNLREAADTIYWMGATGVGFAVLGLFGAYSLQLAWRYWNGNDLRRAVIACLEERALGVQREPRPGDL
jgi:hypothetical protein